MADKCCKKHFLPFFAVFSPKNGKFENLKKTSRDTWMMILNAEFQVFSPSQCPATGCDYRAVEYREVTKFYF